MSDSARRATTATTPADARPGGSPGTESERQATTPGTESEQQATTLKVERSGRRVFVAGLWRRLAAGLIDGLILSPVLLLAGWLAIRITGMPAPASGGFRPELVLELFLWGGLPFYSLIAIAVTLALLYGFLFISLTGNTPGLRLLRSRVINVYGDRPEWWRTLLRCSGLLLALSLLGLGLVWIGFDREKRGLHDWLAGTYVIRGTPVGMVG